MLKNKVGIVTGALSGLDEEALVKIITEPKNSLIKQYKKLFAFDDVILEFEDDALAAIAEKALEQQTGARGLRSILEETLTQLMFDVPKNDNILKVTITRDVVLNKAEPDILYRSNN